MPLLTDFRALDRRVFILAFARLVVTLGFSAVLPYLAVTLQQERGVPKLVVGLIWTTSGLAIIKALPPPMVPVLGPGALGAAAPPMGSGLSSG